MAPRPSPRALAALAAAGALLAALVAAAPALAEPVTITILAINDFHGRIGLDEAPGGVDTTRFAGTIEELRAAYGPESTLLLSAGDNVGASLFASAIAADDPTIDVLRALGLDASAVGNHEFDQGVADLVDRVQPRGGFPYLGANVYRAGSFDPVLPEYAMLEVEGLRIGVVGAVTQETGALVNPAGVAGVEFGDPVDAVNRVAAQLTNGDAADGEADVVIAVYHEGAPLGVDQGGTLERETADSAVFSKIVDGTAPQVAAILTGHTHQAYAWEAPVPGEPGRTRPIVQTGSYAQHVGVLRLTVEPGRGVVASTAELVDPTTTPRAELVAAYPRAAEVDRIVAAALARAEAEGGRRIGSTAAPITTAFSGGDYGPDGYRGGERDDRGRHSALGTLVADALLAALADPARGGAVFAAVNPGGLRADLDGGDVTYRDANSVLPFGNDLWTTTLTGRGVKELLEQQWQRDEDGGVPSRPYLALALSGNVAYAFDPSRPEGDRITSISIDGRPVDPDGAYRMGTWAFLVSGGDNFRAAARGSDARDSGLLDRDAWVAYLGAHPGIAPDFRAPGVAVSGLGDGPVAIGADLELSLGGLDLTSIGAPETSGLDVVWTGSTALAPPTIGRQSDGSMRVALRVPVDAPAASVLVVTARPSGTVVRIPIAVAGGGPAPLAEPPMLSDMEWIWLGAIGLTGGIVVLVVAATIAAFVGRPRP